MITVRRWITGGERYTSREDAGVGQQGVDDARTLLQREGFAVLDGQQAAHVDGEILFVGQRAQQRQEDPLRRRHLDRLRRKTGRRPRRICLINIIIHSIN